MILDVIQDGYKIPLYETPHSAYFRNNRSALAHSDFVTAEITSLLKSGRIQELDQPPTVINPLSVDVKDGKKRLILDLRYVNMHVWKEHIKYEDYRTLKNFLCRGDFIYSFDLKSGYHHVDIFDEHCQYLGFSWTEKGVTRFFIFLVLSRGKVS